MSSDGDRDRSGGDSNRPGANGGGILARLGTYRARHGDGVVVLDLLAGLLAITAAVSLLAGLQWTFPLVAGFLFALVVRWLVANDVLGWLLNYRRRTADSAIAMHLAGGLLTLGTFVLFLAGSQWTIFPFFGVLVVAGVGWVRYQAELVKGLTLLTTMITVGVLALIVVFLVTGSTDAFEHMGLELLTRIEDPIWTDAEGGVYSLAPMMVGTAQTTVIATLVAAPLGVAAAVYISEIAPPRVREIVKPGIELMAGIPSITYGFIGVTIVNAYFYSEFQTPVIGSYFAVGLMIGLMALPTVVTVAEDALSAVPEPTKSGSLAMGTTQWQTTKSVTIPAALSGVSAGVILGVGRAMGETMAATVMLPHTKGFPSPPFDAFASVGETLTTVIAFEGGNANGIHLSALFAAGVVLFVMVMLLSLTSQWVERRMHRKLGGER